MTRNLRPALAAAGLTTLILLVALASRTRAFGQSPPIPGEISQVALDTFLYLAVAIDLLLLALIVWAFTSDRHGELPPLPRRSLLSYVLSPLLVAALLGSAVMLRARLAGGARLGQPGQPGGLLGLPSPPPGLLSGGGVGRAGFDWIALGVVLLLLAVGGAGVAWLLRPRARLRAARTGIGEQAPRALDLGLHDLELEPDPRRAVIAAYARMESVLAWHRLPRHRFEAPLEYLRRILDKLEAAPAADLTRLTSLFQRAKFSRHPITIADKADAIESLRALHEHVV